MFKPKMTRITPVEIDRITRIHLQVRAAREFIQAAKYLQETYYHVYQGWDTRENWWATMILLQEAYWLLDEPFMYPLQPLYIDPLQMLWWTPEVGRTERLKREEQVNALHQAAALTAV